MAGEYGKILEMFKRGEIATTNHIKIGSISAVSPLSIKIDNYIYNANKFDIYVAESLTLSESDIGKTVAVYDADSFLLCVCKIRRV